MTMFESDWKFVSRHLTVLSVWRRNGAFSRRRFEAFTQVRNADSDAQSLTALRAHIQTHDRVMQEHARYTIDVAPLPEAV